MDEKTIIRSAPSQLTNSGFYLLSIILIPVLGLGLIMIIVRFLKTKYTIFELTEERIIEQTGVFSRKTNYTELYRVKDIILEEPFSLRIFGLSTILLITSDKTSPEIKLYGVKNGKELKNTIRLNVEKRRDEKGVKETDFQ